MKLNLYHLASNLLLHYLAKFECCTEQLFIRINDID